GGAIPGGGEVGGPVASGVASGGQPGGGGQDDVAQGNGEQAVPGNGERAGGVRLSAERAREALRRLGERVGLGPDKLGTEEVAVGVVRIAETEMVRALRVISVQRGLDPRDFALVAFGGAGGMHACAVAEELGMRTVLVPRAGGVLSALGLAISDVRRDYLAPLLDRIDRLDADRLTRAWDALAERARADLAGDAVLEQLADLRYQGQSYELTVAGQTPAALAAAFHRAHERRYGHREDGEPVEIVNVRLVATLAGTKPDIVEPDPAPDPRTDRREVFLDGRWQRVDVLDRELMGR